MSGTAKEQMPWKGFGNGLKEKALISGMLQ